MESVILLELLFRALSSTSVDTRKVVVRVLFARLSPLRLGREALPVRGDGSPVCAHIAGHSNPIAAKSRKKREFITTSPARYYGTTMVSRASSATFVFI